MRNLTMLTDLYQLTMMQGYYFQKNDTVVVFDAFYRKNPCDGGYAIFCGLEQLINYINNLKFTDDDISYLREQGIFREEFLVYLKNFKFSGDIYAMEEGTVVFPYEPLVKVVAPIMEAQLIETALLTIINHQSLIATKAKRVVLSAEGDSVMEFGLRRAQGPDAGMYGARAAVISGCIGTSNVLAGKEFNIPIKGTHAHSWVMSFDSEYEAFKTYATMYPDCCILLCDTYNTLKSGVPNAIKVFKEMKSKGLKMPFYGIRLDSGDLAFVSKEARKMLDEAGFYDAIISASSDLDEYLIKDLKSQGAKITSWGVGTNLITSKDCPSFGGVYKLSAIKEENEFIPKIKISENIAKVTNPGNKSVYRIIDKKTNKIKADLIALYDEDINNEKELVLFDPNNTWKNTILEANSFNVISLHKEIFKNGIQTYTSPSVMKIKEKCTKDMEILWPEQKRMVNPEKVHVDLSRKLYKLKSELLSLYCNNSIE